MMIGAHLDNLDTPSEESLNRLLLMRAGIVGTLWTDAARHRRPVYDRLEQLLDRPVYSVRVGPSRKLTARAWARLANEALAELPPAAIDEGRVRLRCLHEVNLPTQGGWDPDDYACFLRAARKAARLPATVQLVAAPVSLGLPDWRDWWQRFVAASGGLIPADRIAVDCYAHLVAEAPFFADYGRPVDVAEINTLELPPGPARAAWLRDRFAELAAAGVESAQVFAVGGRDHFERDDAYILTDEEAELLGAEPTRHAEPPPRHPERSEGSAPHEGASGTDPSASPQDDGSLSGRGMWIWYVANAEGGDPAAILARAHAVGLRYVLIKCGDGGSVWRQFSPELVAALKAGGLEVYGWGYCYGEDVAGELAVAAACLAAGADGYVADVEAEYEGRWREAERFAAGLSDLRTAHPGALIGYSPLPVIDYHQSLPYAQLNRVADVVLPQFYCRALGANWTMERLWEQWHRWSAAWRSWNVPVPRIVPVGEAFGAATGDDLRAQAEPDMSFWAWDHARPEHWEALAELSGGDAGTGRRGDAGTEGRGDPEQPLPLSPVPPVSPSPTLPVPASGA